MKTEVQIKIFDDIISNTTELANNFLKEINTDVISVTPLYNTINGGIIYVIIYKI